MKICYIMGNDFLQMEMDYLLGDLSLTKILITLLIPISPTTLTAAFWKRNLYFGISVMVFIAVAKRGLLNFFKEIFLFLSHIRNKI